MKRKPSFHFDFKQSGSTPCLTCEHVLSKERPILFVTHNRAESWQFMCGHPDHEEHSQRTVSLKGAFEIDPGINALSEMPSGFGAERKTAKGQWEPFLQN